MACGAIGLLLLVNRPRLAHFQSSGSEVLLFAAWCVGVLSVIVAPWVRRFRSKWVLNLLLILLPFFVINAVTLTIRGFQFRHAFNDRPVVLAAQNEAQRRVVWVVFDELDQKLTFDRRPNGLDLPEFDGLRRQSVYARNAYPPPGTATEISFPSLISGQRIEALDIRSPDHLRLRLPGQRQSVEWDAKGTVFSDATRAKIPSAVDGYYNPYCRLISDLASCHCEWERNAFVARVLRKESLRAIISAMAERLWDPEQQVRETHIGTYQTLLPRALADASNGHLGLVLLHLPVPHPPGIYDRRLSQMSTSRNASYLDNLVLADRTLGQIRYAMQHAGVWDRTTLIVSGDHGLRGFLHATDLHVNKEDLLTFDGPMDHRVPFLLKLAGQEKALEIDASFNTVLTRRLIDAVLKGHISTADGALRWLTDNLEPPGPEAPLK